MACKVTILTQRHPSGKVSKKIQEVRVSHKVENHFMKYVMALESPKSELKVSLPEFLDRDTIDTLHRVHSVQSEQTVQSIIEKGVHYPYTDIFLRIFRKLKLEQQKFFFKEFKSIKFPGGISSLSDNDFRFIFSLSGTNISNLKNSSILYSK